MQLTLHIIIISTICIIWGMPLYYYFSSKEKETYWTSNGMGSLIFLFFMGLLTISFFSSWLVLFLPLRFEYLLIGTVIALFISALRFSKLKKKLIKSLVVFNKYPTPTLLFLFTCILLFIILGTLRPVNIDTQLYHLQIIKWTNEYGTVPGLANLYPRLGLGSGLFNLTSIFHMPFFENQNFTYLNTTFVIWFLLWLINKLNLYITKSNKSFALLFFFLILYFLFDWQLFRDTANSTSYDFIVTALTIIVLTYILENVLSEERKEFSLLLIIISLSIIPFKLSGIFVLIPVLYYLTQYRSLNKWGISILVGILIITPLIIKNYITTGYPLFPSTFSFDHPDWMLPNTMAVRFQEYILNVNKFYNQNIGFIFSYEKTIFNWIPFWWKGILVQHKILIILSSLSTLLFVLNPSKDKISKKVLLFILCLWLMMFGWFFTAPDPRFAYGFLLFLSFLPLSIILSRFLSIIKVYPIVLIILIPFLLYYTYKKADPIFKKNNHVLTVICNELPPHIPIEQNGNNYNLPAKINDNWNNRCYLIPLPCICEDNPYLIQRGPSLKNGYRMKSITDSNFIHNYNY